MSELKSFRVIQGDTDGCGAPSYKCDTDGNQIEEWSDTREVYDKSEADKEIDFWKKESHDHYERWFSLNTQYEGWLGKVMRCERAERELRRQKYKRCLAMALLSLEKRETYRAEYEEWCLKWYKRWMELANKFKEIR